MPYCGRCPSHCHAEKVNYYFDESDLQRDYLHPNRWKDRRFVIKEKFMDQSRYIDQNLYENAGYVTVGFESKQIITDASVSIMGEYYPRATLHKKYETIQVPKQEYRMGEPTGTKRIWYYMTHFYNGSDQKTCRQCTCLNCTAREQERRRKQQEANERERLLKQQRQQYLNSRPWYRKAFDCIINCGPLTS